jgi:hypothetical protein
MIIQQSAKWWIAGCVVAEGGDLRCHFSLSYSLAEQQKKSADNAVDEDEKYITQPYPSRFKTPTAGQLESAQQRMIYSKLSKIGH